MDYVMSLFAEEHCYWQSEKQNKTEDFRGENITLFILHFHKSAFFFLIYISVAHL